MKTTSALIVAAGRGSRAGEGLPKQYRLLNSEMVIAKTLKAFATHEKIDDILVVIHKDDEVFFKSLNLNVAYCFGGETRQKSVLNGLLALVKCDNVLIHDAARPFVSEALITSALQALETHEAAIPALPVTDTIKQVDNGFVTHTPLRETLFAVQTPQAFHYKAILEAHLALKHLNLTDDASLFEHLGKKPAIIKGEATNIKLTYESDFMAKKRTKVGQGYDVHAFKEGDFVMLGGVKIPSSRAIIAHSDGDVILHALTDAILGVIGEGDIGTHFPPSDEQWKGVSSDRFLQHACRLLAERGGELVHIDISLLAETPKIMKYREEIRLSIATIANTALENVGLKATTSEKLGFIGRKEGLAALALVTVEI